MESLNIETSKKRLCLNGDESKIIEFNPEDLDTRKKFFDASKEIFQKQREYDIAVKEIESEQDDMKKTEKAFELEQNLYNLMKSIVDDIFGNGTSDMITDGKANIFSLVNFIIAITPYFRAVTDKQKNKYTNNLKSAGLI